MEYRGKDSSGKSGDLIFFVREFDIFFVRECQGIGLLAMFFSLAKISQVFSLISGHIFVILLRIEGLLEFSTVASTYFCLQTIALRKELTSCKKKISQSQKQLVETNTRLEESDRRFEEQNRKLEEMWRELKQCQAELTLYRENPCKCQSSIPDKKAGT